MDSKHSLFTATEREGVMWVQPRACKIGESEWGFLPVSVNIRDFKTLAKIFLLWRKKLFYAIFFSSIWQMPLFRTTYIYTTEQLVKGPSVANWWCWNLNSWLLWSEVEHLKHWATTTGKWCDSLVWHTKVWLIFYYPWGS